MLERPRGEALQRCWPCRPHGADGHHDRRPGRPPTARCTRCRRRSSDCHGLQCGFCTPGMVMSAVDLVQEPPTAPTEEQIRARPGRQPVPLHRLPQHRQGRGAGRRGDEVKEAATMNAPAKRLHRPERRATRGLRASHRRGHITPTTSRCQARPTATSCARRTRTRASRSIDTAAAAKAPGVLGDLHRRATSRQVGGLPCGWLITQHRRHADEGAARIRCWPTARCATSATSVGAGRRRDAASRPKAAVAADRGRLRRAARGGRRAPRAAKAGAGGARRGAGQPLLPVGPSATRTATDAAFKAPRT